MHRGKEEKEYRVSWEIDVSAENPEEAVMLAVGWLGPIQPGRWCYTVTGEDGGRKAIEGEELF